MKLSDVTSTVEKIGFPLARPTWPDSVPRSAPRRRTGLNYDHEWSRRYPVRLARAMLLDNVALPLSRVVASTRVEGKEHLRGLNGPVIFAANHTSHLDTPLLLTSIPTEFRHRTVVAAASDYFFDRTWKANLWAFSLAAIPIERTKVNRHSADVAASLLDDGWSLVIFPEGGRSPDGWTQEFRGGAAYLARRTGRPVVPVYIDGTRKILPKRSSSDKLPLGGSGSENRAGPGLRRHDVRIVFGAPMRPVEGEDARKFSARIERSVGLLGEETATDWWRARRNAASGAPAWSKGPDASPWRRSWALDRRSRASGPSSYKEWPPEGS